MTVGPTRLKYLEMLQAVVARMSGNQFTARTWSVTLGTAIVGYAAAKDGNPAAAFIAILPTVLFWITDAYYLALEQGFRDVFKRAAQVHDDEPDFSFGQGPDASAWLGAGFRPAVFLIHLPIVIVACLVGFRVFRR